MIRPHFFGEQATASLLGSSCIEADFLSRMDQIGMDSESITGAFYVGVPVQPTVRKFTFE